MSVLEAVQTINPPPRHDAQVLDVYRIEVLGNYDSSICEATGHGDDCFSFLKKVALQQNLWVDSGSVKSPS